MTTVASSSSTDDAHSHGSGLEHPARLSAGAFVVAAVTAAVAIAVAMALGPVSLPLGGVVVELLNQIPFVHLDSTLSTTETAILLDLRAPRVLLAFVVGALLAAAGGGYQGVFRNPLADPYLLGVAAGAGLGATIAIVGTDGDLAGPTGVVPATAFAGALVAVALTYALGVSNNRLRSNTSLILAGVAVAALITAIQTFLLQSNDEAVREVYAWLLGRFNATGWNDLLVLMPYAVVALVLLLACAARLDVMAVGDDEARTLGMDPRRIRAVVIVGASLGTAAAVAVSGLIAFVGIIVPHAIRLWTGPSYRKILPLSIVYGGAFLCLADLIARTALAPTEVPISVITAVVGAPVFFVLLRSTRLVSV
jgi:iron complex transport system permease protein